MNKIAYFTSMLLVLVSGLLAYDNKIDYATYWLVLSIYWLILSQEKK